MPPGGTLLLSAMLLWCHWKRATTIDTVTPRLMVMVFAHCRSFTGRGTPGDGVRAIYSFCTRRYVTAVSGTKRYRGWDTLFAAVATQQVIL